MDYLTALFELNYSNLVISIFVIVLAIIFVVNNIEKLLAIIKRPVSWILAKNTDHELLARTIEDLELLKQKQEEDTRQAVRHDEMIREDLQRVSETMLQIKDEVTLMRTQRDEDKLAEYKDKIGESYRFYCSRKYSDEEPIPYWNHMEKEALKGLITQYEAHGGSNSFVHSKVEVEMQTWKVID